MSITIGKMLDQTGYLQALRDENSEEANERIENLMELVSAAREYETREPEASLGGFVDRLSLLSEADEESGTREAQGLDDDDARGQGAGVPGRHHRRPGRGAVPALALERGRRGARGRASPLLRRHDARGVEAGAHERRAPPGVRRVPVDRAVTIPRRDPAELVERITPAFASPYQSAFNHGHYEFRTNPYGRGGRPAAASRKTAPPTSTRTKTSPARACAPGCACGTRSSASAA